MAPTPSDSNTMTSMSASAATGTNHDNNNDDRPKPPTSEPTTPAPITPSPTVEVLYYPDHGHQFCRNDGMQNAWMESKDIFKSLEVSTSCILWGVDVSNFGGLTTTMTRLN